MLRLLLAAAAAVTAAAKTPRLVTRPEPLSVVVPETVVQPLANASRRLGREPPAPAAPFLWPAPSTEPYDGSVAVSLVSPDVLADATLALWQVHYTLDGTAPTRASPWVRSGEVVPVEYVADCFPAKAYCTGTFCWGRGVGGRVAFASVPPWSPPLPPPPATS